MSPRETRHVRITGRVQGVAYRAWTRATATRLGLAGWVRNTHDGAVEAMVQGDRDSVERMITAFYDGPGAAQVTQVETEPVAEAPALDRFEIRH